MAYFAKTADNIKGHILQFNNYRRYGISMLKKLIAAGAATVTAAATMALPAFAWWGGRGFSFGGFGFGRGFGLGFSSFGLGFGGLGFGGFGSDGPGGAGSASGPGAGRCGTGGKRRRGRSPFFYFSKTGYLFSDRKVR